MARSVCAVGVVVPGAGQVIVCHGHLGPGVQPTVTSLPTLTSHSQPPHSSLKAVREKRIWVGSGNWMMAGMFADYYRMKGVLLTHRVVFHDL